MILQLFSTLLLVVAVCQADHFDSSNRRFQRRGLYETAPYQRLYDDDRQQHVRPVQRRSLKSFAEDFERRFARRSLEDVVAEEVALERRAAAAAADNTIDSHVDPFGEQVRGDVAPTFVYRRDVNPAAAAEAAHHEHHHPSAAAEYAQHQHNPNAGHHHANVHPDRRDVVAAAVAADAVSDVVQKAIDRDVVAEDIQLESKRRQGHTPHHAGSMGTMGGMGGSMSGMGGSMGGMGGSMGGMSGRPSGSSNWPGNRPSGSYGSSPNRYPMGGRKRRQLFVPPFYGPGYGFGYPGYYGGYGYPGYGNFYPGYGNFYPGYGGFYPGGLPHPSIYFRRRRAVPFSSARLRRQVVVDPAYAGGAVVAADPMLTAGGTVIAADPMLTAGGAVIAADPMLTAGPAVVADPNLTGAHVAPFYHAGPGYIAAPGPVIGGPDAGYVAAGGYPVAGVL